jgi:hypothetical protein
MTRSSDHIQEDVTEDAEKSKLRKHQCRVCRWAIIGLWYLAAYSLFHHTKSIPITLTDDIPSRLHTLAMLRIERIAILQSGGGNSKSKSSDP